MKEFIEEIFNSLETQITEEITPYVNEEFERIDAEFNEAVAADLAEFEAAVTTQHDHFTQNIAGEIYDLHSAELDPYEKNLDYETKAILQKQHDYEAKAALLLEKFNYIINQLKEDYAKESKLYEKEFAGLIEDFSSALNSSSQECLNKVSDVVNNWKHEFAAFLEECSA